ncbi:dihydropteroate synthase-like protein, partial [Thermococci archaeon]
MKCENNNMKILLITGILAEPLVRKFGKGCDVFVCPVSVAAFLTPRMIVNCLKKAHIKDYDLILIPGLVRGSAQEIEDSLGIPTFKGPRNAYDIPQVLEALKKGFKLSKEIPADDLFKIDALKKVEDIKNRTKNRRYIEKALKKPCNFLIGNLPVGLDFPQRIVAEIVDAPKLNFKGLLNKALHYLKSGADIVDIGMVSGEEHLEFVETISELRDALKELGHDVPISFDSL